MLCTTNCLNVHNDYTTHKLKFFTENNKRCCISEIGRLALVDQNAVRPTKPRISVVSCKSWLDSFKFQSLFMTSGVPVPNIIQCETR